MLTSITIKGLRGIAHGELNEIAPLTVIVGPNGSGKSTILDAINLACGVPDEAIRFALRRREEFPGELRWLLKNGAIDSRAEVSGKVNGKEIDVFLSCQRGDDSTIHCEWSASDYDFGEAPSFSTRMTTVAEWIGDVNRESTSGGFRVGEPVESVRFLDLRSKRALRPMHELHTDAISSGHRKQEQELIANLLPGADSIEILTSHGHPVAFAVFPDRAVPIALVGDGVENVLRLALEAFTLSKGVLILEEPETHLHPAAVAHAARLIVSGVRRGLQIILSTHSIEFIDRLIAECEEQELERFVVFQTLLERERLVVVRIPGEEVAFARAKIEDDLR